MDPIKDLHNTMARQRFVLRKQAVRGGMSDRQFTAEVRRVGWQPAGGGAWVARADVLDHADRVRLALATVGHPSLVTGASNLFLRGVLTKAHHEVHLVTPLGRSPAKRAGVRLYHTTTYGQIRYQTRGGLNLAAVPRAIADYAASASHKDLCFAIANALRLRLCTLRQLEDELKARRRFPGRTRMRTAVADMRGETTHSSYERSGRRLLRGAGIAVVSKPLPVEINGKLEAEIDIAVDDVLYGVEIDGPNHLLPEQAAADRARDRRLSRIGWTIDRFFWFELDERPQWFVNEVSTRLRALR